jgi:hypothetical protein
MYEGINGTTYPRSTVEPVNVGDYAITVDIAEGANYAAAAGLPLGTLTILKAAPTLEDLNYEADTVLYGYYTGDPYDRVPVPTIKAPSTGLGTVTLKYNGDDRQPVYPGDYVITASISEGANYRAAELLLGRLVIIELPYPQIVRRVTLDVSPHFASDPLPGTFYVESHKDLYITLTPLPTLPEGYAPHVTTSRSLVPDDKGGVKMTLNDDGTYKVRIVSITEEMTVTIEAVDPLSGVSNDAIAAAARVWSVGSRLYVAAGATSGRAYIYNLAGTLVKILPFAAGQTVVTPLPAGLYIVRGNDGWAQKIVIQ